VRPLGFIEIRCGRARAAALHRARAIGRGGADAEAPSPLYRSPHPEQIRHGEVATNMPLAIILIIIYMIIIIYIIGSHK
jgi:hypothetical protein